MPWPKVVGGFTVRERPQRYEGQPRYKRLDFIRTKKSHDDIEDWPIIKTTQSAPPVPLPVPQPLEYLPYYHEHQEPHWWYQDPHFHLHDNGDRGQLEWVSQHHHRIEGPHPEIINLGSVHDDEEAYFDPIIEERAPKKKKKDQTAKPKFPEPTGHSIFDDSSDEDDYQQRRSKSKSRGRSRSRLKHDYDNERTSRSKVRAW